MKRFAPAIPVSVPVDRIFLDLGNPRHEPSASEDDAIAYLCQHERVSALARDIVNIGLNPLDLFALIPKGQNSRNETTFTVAEGNRRMCALKLLHDPDRAPVKYRSEIQRLSVRAPEIQDVMAIVFQNHGQVKDWLDRIHGGEQGGIGRKSWDPDQKARSAGDRKNLLAKTILDYATNKGFISAEDRKGRLTTAQRFLGNSFMKEALGLEGDTAEELTLNRPVDDFDSLVKRFTDDLVEGKDVTSRMNSPEIKDYARDLVAGSGVSHARTEAQALLTPNGSFRKLRSPKRPPAPKKIAAELDIEQRLQNLQSYKLQKLYYSICQISVEAHTPLIAVGVWSFMETLTARCGRKPDTSFKDFLSKQKLNALSLVGRDVQNPILQAVARISDYGNTTKHHDKAGQFNGEQIVTDMDTLKDTVCKLADSVVNEPVPTA